MEVMKKEIEVVQKHGTYGSRENQQLSSMNGFVNGIPIRLNSLQMESKYSDLLVKKLLNGLIRIRLKCGQ